MSQDAPKNLAEQLIEAEGSRQTSPTPGSPPTDPVFESLIEAENQFEARIRRAAVLSWTLTFTTLVLSAVLVFLIRNLGGTVQEVARSALLVVGATGLCGLLAGMLTSIRWLFRSRAPSLRAIERRLAALEQILMSRQAA